MNNLFYLDDIEIEEPVGFADIELSIKRDDTFHGMSYEASTSSLQFHGIAAIYLKELKESLGVRANVTFKALQTCENYDYEEIISGRLNFGKYKENCGTECTVSIPIEQESCAIIFNSRKSQKVDVNKDMGIDGTTPLPQYAALNVETEIPTHNLKGEIDANVSDDGYEVPEIETGLFNEVLFAFRPLYLNKRFESINTGNIDSGVDSASTDPVGGLTDVISPQLLFNDAINCFDGQFDYSFRLKGNINVNIFDGTGVANFFRVRIAKGEWPGTLTDVDIQNLTYTGNDSFDVTLSGTTSLSEGQGLYALLEVDLERTPAHQINAFINVAFDKESSVLITANKSCPATNAEFSMIHETLSRVSESITNGCVRVKSSFYGRTDSEPFSFSGDGCGGLRTLTSGLKIRNAIEDNFFTSIEELIKGLNAIDNIGFDIIQDPDIPSRSLLRIEDVTFFYRDEEILRHDGIPKGITEMEESKIYAKIDAGYKKWEVEDVNGLNEFNSGRQFNTSIDTVNTSLDIASNLVTGTYPIEITRQQSFANSGGADTKYDNETFLICMRRTSYPYGNIEVEIDNIDNPQNIFSPTTIKNYRISPIRNLMRWFKSIMGVFNSLTDAILFFSSGSGNLIASGKMTDSTCRQENTEMAENQNIFVTQFEADFTPIWKPEIITYDYPMSIKDYRKVKANPYGYISAECGEFLKYWIKEIKYKPMKGIATITARRKYVA